MLKQILISTALTVCFFLTANAQTDTASYDLGRVSVKKQFTQSITIKGADLERMQFSDLADAINVWLYGTYTNAASLVYVVEGNIITDVNIYSVYDVDEITMVQSAIAQVTGAGPGQQLVFIKLKTNRPGKQGIEVAGQTSLVNANGHPNPSGYKSSTNIYDQYYISGYKNFNDVQVGVSVDYQHDVMPFITNNNYGPVNPLNFNRFKFNGYVNAKLWTGTTLNLGLNYVPHQNREALTYSAQPYTTGESYVSTLKAGSVEHTATSALALNSRIVKGLTNTLSAAYSHYNFFEADSLSSVYTTSGFPDQDGKAVSGVYNKTSNFLLRDNLVFQTKMGIFDVEPSLNFSYRKYDNTYRDSVETLIYSSGLPSYSTSEQGTQLSEKLYLLTPSVNIAYKNIFNLQGGFIGLLNSNKDFAPGYQVNRLYPFVSTSLDIFKLANLNNVSLQVFGSFSRQNQLLDDPYQTIDGFAPLGFAIQENGVYYFGTTTGTIPYSYVNSTDPLKQLNDYQAGFVFGIGKSFSISYNYFENYDTDLLIASVPTAGNSSTFVYYDYYSKLSANRVALNYNFAGTNFSWRSGLNVAQEKLQAVNNDTYLRSSDTYLSTGHRYSGGFTNRFTYKTFFAGMDILYQFGQRPITLAGLDPDQMTTPPHVNSIALQNLYLGGQVKLNDIKYAEVFASFHNILQNNSSNITDNRRFYGLGVKVGW